MKWPPKKQFPPRQKQHTLTDLEFNLPDLYPEGIEYRPSTQTIYLGSMAGQPIKMIDKEGKISDFNKGEQPFPLGTIGIEIDEVNGRLIACCSDRDKQYERAIAQVRVYDLESGALLQDLNLAPLLEAEEYQANDATVTADGTIILSDRKGNALYKIDKNYEAAIFYRNEETLKMPNGLAYHPDGFVLVAQSKDHPQLCKFPYSNPENRQEVRIEDERFQGFDGLVLADKNRVVGVSTIKSNQGKDALIELTTTDNWQSASISNYQEVNSSTTVAQVSDQEYYVLNQDFRNPSAKTVVVERVVFENE